MRGTDCEIDSDNIFHELGISSTSLTIAITQNQLTARKYMPNHIIPIIIIIEAHFCRL